MLINRPHPGWLLNPNKVLWYAALDPKNTASYINLKEQDCGHLGSDWPEGLQTASECEHSTVL